MISACALAGEASGLQVQGVRLCLDHLVIRRWFAWLRPPRGLAAIPRCLLMRIYRQLLLGRGDGTDVAHQVILTHVREQFAPNPITLTVNASMHCQTTVAAASYVIQAVPQEVPQHIRVTQPFYTEGRKD
jgi:hypothetical protein